MEKLIQSSAEFCAAWKSPECDDDGDVIATDLTWSKIIAIEPRLADLFDEIKAIRDDKTRPRFCANARWYGRNWYDSLKERMCRLVGFEAAKSALRSADAYDLVYDKLYNALPDCRGCDGFC